MYYNPFNESHVDEGVHNVNISDDLHADERVYNVNTFYEHINGDGASFTLNSGDQMAFVGGPWNDQISSVSVAPRTLVILYEHINFTGRKKNLFNYNYNSPYLFNIHRDFNDIVSAIKTVRLG